MLLNERITEVLSNQDDTIRELSNIFIDELSISGEVSTKNYLLIDILYDLLDKEFIYSNINFELYKSLDALLNVVLPLSLADSPNYPTPTITTQVVVSDTDPITFTDTIINTNSAVQSLTFSASNLTANLLITCDSEFYISLDPYSGFSKELFFPVSSGTTITNVTIFIRFSPITLGSHSGTLTFNTIGITDIEIDLSGTGLASSIPTITLSTSYLTKFAATLPSTISLEEQSYIITASGLTANLVVTPPTDFEISLTSGSGFTASPITIVPTGGAISSTIYVRFHPTQLKFYNARIANTSTGATSKYVVVQGTGAENTSLLDSPADATTDGYLKHTDWVIFNNKQNQLNGTGFVKISGTTISYDPATYTPSSHIGSGGSAHAEVTTSVNGFMSAADKLKLDGIEAGANNYVHPSTHSADIIVDGTTNKAYTATEKTKLAGIADGAEVNVNADWDATSGDAQILNKPTIPTQSVTSTTFSLVKNSVTASGSCNIQKIKIGSGYSIVTIDIYGAWNPGVTFTDNEDWGTVPTGYKPLGIGSAMVYYVGSNFSTVYRTSLYVDNNGVIRSLYDNGTATSIAGSITYLGRDDT